MKNWYTRIRFEATCEQQVIADNADDARAIALESIENRSFTQDVEMLWSHVSTELLPKETRVKLKDHL